MTAIGRDRPAAARPLARVARPLSGRRRGFAIVYRQEAEQCAHRSLDGAELLLEQIVDPERALLVGEPEYPFGRGCEPARSRRRRRCVPRRGLGRPGANFWPIETRWYVRGDDEVGARQFVAFDTGGYLLQFAQDLGVR